MKFLEITPEIEQSLVQVFDASLKASGMSVLCHIDRIRNAIQIKIDIPKES